MTRSEDVMALSIRRGFLWPAADLYGGFSGFYDYGHSGAALKRKWEDRWLSYFLGLDDNYHLIDAATIMPEAALKASGHVEHFTDLLVSCLRCKETFRGDHLLEAKVGGVFEGLTPEELGAKLKEAGVVCPECKGTLGDPRPFNMMFPVAIGPTGADKAYLRPETAQGVFLNFKREFEALRRRLPLGLAIVGRAYRNEISPRQGTYRMREFQQAELQIFFDPATFDTQVPFDAVAATPLHITWAGHRADRSFETLAASEVTAKGVPRFFAYHLAVVQRFYLEVLGLPPEHFRFAELSEKERAFYNRVHFDIEVAQESLGGFREVGGVHYRGDHDLGGHAQGSKQNLSVNIDGRKFTPNVLELSFGVDRNVWALLDAGYGQREERLVLRLPPRLAPITLGIFPLVKKDGLAEIARDLHASLRTRYDCVYDPSDSVGRRYARLDEIGTPLCITVDYQTKDDRTVTLRRRDTGEQSRESLDALVPAIEAALGPSTW